MRFQIVLASYGAVHTKLAATTRNVNDSTDARRAGLGSSGIAYPQTGSATSGFSSSEQDFRHADRDLPGTIGRGRGGSTGQREL